MNIKIKSAGVACLIGEDYDRVYAALKKQFADSDEQLFSERIPGHEYLQWTLSGEGWTSLAEADPLMMQEVKQELLKRQQAICQRFGNNQETARKVLTVPDDSYVYYKADPSGRLLIRLTAWGYRYPERIGTGPAVSRTDPKAQTEHVTISLVYDGEPVPNNPFKMNGFLRSTDDNGIFEVGELPIGYELTIETDDGQQKQFIVTTGKGDIKIDVTRFASVSIHAERDGAPYAAAAVSLQYVNRQLNLTTDETGNASVKLPLDPNGSSCTVRIDSETQHQLLSDETTHFLFQFTTPEVVVVEEEEKVEEPVVVQEQEKDEEPEVVQETEIVKENPEPPKFSVLSLCLLLLALLLLVAATYFACFMVLF